MNTPIGSISHATMRPEDLIPTFADTLEELAKDNPEHIDNLNAIRKQSEKIGYYESEDCEFDLEWLFDALDSYSPSYCYFGSHEGDGSDYGFWPNLMILDDDIRMGEIVSVSDPSEVPESGDAVFINDHGNVTFYVDSQVEWDCV